MPDTTAPRPRWWSPPLSGRCGRSFWTPSGNRRHLALVACHTLAADLSLMPTELLIQLCEARVLNATDDLTVPTATSSQAVAVAWSRRQLGNVPARNPWYPGSTERAQAFCKAFPDAEEIADRDGAMPWRFKAGLAPDQVQADACMPPCMHGHI